ncbi:MAG: hypothetical protein LBK95_11430 [Bifidobacteriaceae bacterium]|jgi:hypothetical protein|nr:hypothetical protein [Bifidobacteriaceae bacterium]
MVQHPNPDTEAMQWACSAPVGSPLERCVLVDMARVGAYWPARNCWRSTDLATAEFCAASVADIEAALVRLVYVLQYVAEVGDDAGRTDRGGPAFRMFRPSQVTAVVP